MTIIDTIADEHYGDRVKMAMAFADAPQRRRRARCEADGVDVIQFDEPAFNVYMDEVKDWGIEALHRAIEGSHARPPCTSATATASRRTSTGRRRSAPSGGSTRRSSRRSRRAASTRSRSRRSNSHVPIDLIALLEGKDVLVGVIDVASDTVETPEEVAATIEAATQVRAEASASVPAPIAAWRRCAGTSPLPSSRRSAPARSWRASGCPRP